MMPSYPSSLFAPPAVHPVAAYDGGDIQALMLDSVPYEGHPTRVFGYFGLPAVAAAPRSGAPCPGVLLLHGGGGTAFPQWVRLWTARGYAALALDLEGHIPLRFEPACTDVAPHDHAGPARQGEFGDIRRPVEDQWMYHAVAAGIAGISFLRAHPGVDADRVGVSGISWGGMVTTNLLCADHRPAFAIPVYGCGSLAGGETYFSPVFAREEVRALWEPAPALPQVTAPTFWLNGGMDGHFPPDATDRCRAAVPGASMLLIPDLEHGYIGAAWEVEEVYAFADAACGRGSPFLRFADPFDGTLLPGERRPVGAVQWTAPAGIRYPVPERRCATRWEAQDAAITGGRVALTPPPDGGVAYITVTDDLGRRVSSPLFGTALR